MVISFSLLIKSALLYEESDRQEEGVRVVRVEDLVGPHHGDHIVLAHILDVVGVAGGNVHHLQLVAGNVVFNDLGAVQRTEADHAGTFHHQELLF